GGVLVVFSAQVVGDRSPGLTTVVVVAAAAVFVVTASRPAVSVINAVNEATSARVDTCRFMMVPFYVVAPFARAREPSDERFQPRPNPNGHRQPVERFSRTRVGRLYPELPMRQTLDSEEGARGPRERGASPGTVQPEVGLR